jgi:hypothetical protein
MKKLVLICASALVITMGAHAQGLINFANVGQPMFLPDGTTKTSSATPIWVGLFLTTDLGATVNPGFGADLSSWYFSEPAKAPTANGLFSGGVRTITQWAPGTAVQAQVRVWSSRFSGDYAGYAASILNSTEADLWGYGAVPKSMNLGGGTLTIPFLTTQGGLTSFTLQTAIPEPSTLALALLGGLGTLVLIRRRK